MQSDAALVLLRFDHGEELGYWADCPDAGIGAVFQLQVASLFPGFRIQYLNSQPFCGIGTSNKNLFGGE